ncbi:HYR domain-containing protein [Lacibacter sp. H375]|uniref:HYR domain-containing protein n=1 Tax=Lacibacter sp. H375 TaxID=3133424 RepID=UPI0030BE7951
MRNILIISCLLSGMLAFAQPGSLDKNFAVFGISTQPAASYFSKVAVQPGDGKIVVLDGYQKGILRFTTNGIPDNGFGVNGRLDVSYFPNDVAITATGKIVVAGNNGSIYQYNSDGSPDQDFGVAGVTVIDVLPISVSLNAITIDAQNRLVVTGSASFSGYSTTTFVVARFNSDGTSDGSFNGGSNVFIEPFDNDYIRQGIEIGVRNDGKIFVIVNSQIPGTPSSLGFLISYNDNGSINTGFSDDGRIDFQMNTGHKAFAFDANGKIVILPNGNPYRINTDGTIDNTFITVLAFPPVEGETLSIQPDGRIIVAGSSWDAPDRFALCRYNTDGSYDNSFGNGGSVITDLNFFSTIYSIAIHNKKIYAVGRLLIVPPNSQFGLPYGVLAAYDGSAVRLSCPGNQQQNTNLNQCYATVNNIDPILTPSDVPTTVNYKIEFNGNIIEQGTGSVSDKNFSKGVTTVTYSLAEGSGQPCSFTITVADKQAPSIVCPSNVSVNTSSGQCSAVLTSTAIGSATATDNCAGTITIGHSPFPPENVFPIGVTSIVWTATDSDGNSSTCTQTITVVDNQPPVITGETASTYVLSPPNHTMRDVMINYTATDNCAVTTTVTVTSSEPINGVGDGDTDPDYIVLDNVAGAAGQYVSNLKLRAERSAAGSGRTYTVTITATDPSGNIASKIIEVKVPHDIKKPHSGQPFIVGSTVNFEGEFWDKPGNKHTAKWLIDDAISAKAMVLEPSGNKNGKITGSYKFTAPGVYKLQMNITDQTGLTTSTNTAGDLEAIVVIYDPNGGHTYGGGYFNSPAGALQTDPSATGKASYGFTMNYFKNSTYPKGETQFEFKVGSFEFNALNFEYLAINNSMAQFKGTGKIIGGQSGVAFTMTVVDGQLDGTGVDKIRMKIYNKNNGKIIYDNQPGASDAALPTQAVGANSVIVIGAGIKQSATPGNEVPIVRIESNQLTDRFEVGAFPNPHQGTFSLRVQSPMAGKMTIEYFTTTGAKIYMLEQQVKAYEQITVPNTGLKFNGTIFYKVSINGAIKTGKIIGIK